MGLFKAADIVRCETCKHMVQRSDAKKVLEGNYGSESNFYCPEHSPVYDKVIYASYYGSPIDHYYVKREWVEVDKDGNALLADKPPVKKKK